MNANEIEIHYALPEGVHSANAFCVVRAEQEFLHILKESAGLLDIEFTLEAQALAEGGLRQIWKAFGKNAGQISTLIALAALVMSLRPSADKELVDLQKEEARLHIQLLKQQLGTAANPATADDAAKAAKEVSDDIKIVRRRSNFYQAISADPKIASVSFSIRNDGALAADPILIPRDDFPKYIALTGELPSTHDDEAVIGIISPVLKKGRFKWKGEYKGEYIEFWIQDKKFRESVLKKEVEFHSGTAIGCILESRLRVDEVGEVTPSGHYVKVVKKVLTEDFVFSTESGKKFEAEKLADENQFKLF